MGGDAWRFPVRFTGLNRAMWVLGLTRGRCFVAVDDVSLEVRMGWAFSATVPSRALRSATIDTDPVRGWGVHGWRGVWLVNGSSSGIVRIGIDAPARARLLLWRVRLDVLRVAVDDPAALVDAVTAATAS